MPSALNCGTVVTMAELTRQLVEHHLSSWPTRDYNIVRVREKGRSVDVGCSSEILNTPISRFSCSFFVKVRKFIIFDSCSRHNCPVPSLVAKNGQRKSPVRTSVALEFFKFETQNQPQVSAATISKKLAVNVEDMPASHPCSSNLPIGPLHINKSAAFRALNKARHLTWKGHPANSYKMVITIVACSSNQCILF